LGKIFIPWGSKGSADALRRAALPTLAPEPPEDALPPGILPLQLWPSDGEVLPPNGKPIVVDNMLTKWLRPHQREGCACAAHAEQPAPPLKNWR
jgi:DNA repair and recombination RAD54-like protein